MIEFLDSPSKLCLKDLSKAVTTEVAIRLESDRIALERFYKSYGLDPYKLRLHNLGKISEFFPDTPVKELQDVFEALQLYDLVELLEKVKPRTLRPALPLKEIEKLPNASNRPAKFYSRAEVLIIDPNNNNTGDSVERIGSFFKTFNSRSKVTKLTAKPAMDLVKDVNTLRKSKWLEDAELTEKESVKELLHTGKAVKRYR